MAYIFDIQSLREVQRTGTVGFVGDFRMTERKWPRNRCAWDNQALAMSGEGFGRGAVGPGE